MQGSTIQMDSAAKQNLKRTLTEVVSKFSENVGNLEISDET